MGDRFDVHTPFDLTLTRIVDKEYTRKKITSFL